MKHSLLIENLEIHQQHWKDLSLQGGWQRGALAQYQVDYWPDKQVRK